MCCSTPRSDLTTAPAATHPTTLLAAGSNARGQLGIGFPDDASTFTPCVFQGHGPHLPSNTRNIASLASGANHTIVLLEYQDETVQLWGVGDGNRGQLGPERASAADGASLVFQPLSFPFGEVFSQEEAVSYTPRLVAAAWETSFVVLSCRGKSDVLVSMGSNDFGLLGVGESLETPNKPRAVSLGAAIRHQTGDAGLISVKSIQAGPRHVVVELQSISIDGAQSLPFLVGWGASRHGQLGQKTNTPSICHPISIPMDAPSVPLRSYALGNEHTVVVHESHRISTFGSNRKGQLEGLSSLKRLVAGVGCTWNGTYVHVRDCDQDIVLATGSNAKGQLGIGRPTTINTCSINGIAVAMDFGRIIKLACGSEHVLTLTARSANEGDTVWGWGWNEHGNLGLGMLDDVSRPVQLWPRGDPNLLSGKRVVDVWAAYGTSWLALS